jgi:competence protein ComGC
LMISKSEASFIVLLVVSIFVLMLVSWIAKAILE